MKELLSISNSNQLSELLDLIHDQQFEKNVIRFDSTTARLQIPFEREDYKQERLIWKKWFLKKWHLPIVESVLVVEYVRSYEIEDKADIGSYLFNTIQYLSTETELLITAEPSFSLRIKVDGFHLSVSDTGRVLKTKTYLSS